MRKVLLSTPRFAAAICAYGAGERHRLHADARSRISMLVRGGYREDAKLGTITMGPGEVLLKSRRALHDDTFGDNGATLVALEFLEDDPFDAPHARDLWRRRADGFALRHAAVLLEALLAGDCAAAGAAGEDLVAQCGAEPPKCGAEPPKCGAEPPKCGAEPPKRGAAPQWLRCLKDELEANSLADIDVAATARAAGAHPAHASRLLRQCYGQSITEYAQAQSVRRALAQIADTSISLSDAALAAGFYEQSHMNRVFSRGPRLSTARTHRRRRSSGKP